jgi:hypothetical protein
MLFIFGPAVQDGRHLPVKKKSNPLFLRLGIRMTAAAATGAFFSFTSPCYQTLSSRLESMDVG